MARRESTLPNMIIALSVITCVSAAILGLAYVLTFSKIEKNRAQTQVDAVSNVLPSFNNNPSQEKFDVSTERGVLSFYPAKQDGQLVAVAVETLSFKGYSGQIRLMVGFLPSGEIYNIQVLEHKETPGLGAKIDSSLSDFPVQFHKKNPKNFSLKVKKDGGEIDAITAATISSRAYCDAVQFAYNALMTSLQSMRK